MTTTAFLLVAAAAVAAFSGLAFILFRPDARALANRLYDLAVKLDDFRGVLLIFAAVVIAIAAYLSGITHDLIDRWNLWGEGASAVPNSIPSFIDIEMKDGLPPPESFEVSVANSEGAIHLAQDGRVHSSADWFKRSSSPSVTVRLSHNGRVVYQQRFKLVIHEGEFRPLVLSIDRADLRRLVAAPEYEAEISTETGNAAAVPVR